MTLPLKPKSRTWMVVAIVLILAASGALAWWLSHAIDGIAAPANVSQAAADRMEKKLAQIVANGSAKSPAPQVVTLTQDEINSYFQYKMQAKIPKGVSNVQFVLRSGRVSGSAIVNFDELKAAQKKPVNPLVDQLLSGTKPVGGMGTFTSGNGKGTFHLEQVSVGAMTLSGFMLDLVIRYFVQPRYPNAVIDRPFDLPERIDRLVIEEGRAVIYQK